LYGWNLAKSGLIQPDSNLIQLDSCCIGRNPANLARFRPEFGDGCRILAIIDWSVKVDCII
jgi:hypothetical protein